MDHNHREEGTSFALSTPADTPYRTPPRSRSRQSRRHRSISPDLSSSPAHFLPNYDSSPKRGQDAMNSATDESISPLDPRRFTPSLHASLVAEILSLRREAEGKTKDIEQLEASLHTTRNENESLHVTLASTSRETRSWRHQMQLLEGGTASAMSELSKERDEAINDSADLRKRLELSQKKVRGQEESVERIQMLWDRDRGTWQTDKRALETKVHIVEGRLKVVLSEIAHAQMINGQILHQDVNHHESPKKMHLRQGSAASLRSIGLTGRRRDSEVLAGTQEGDLHGYRLSTATIAHGHSTSLADELAFDEVEEEEDQMDHNAGQEEHISADELPEERPMSAQSHPFDMKARKVLGLGPEDQLPTLSKNEQQRQSIDKNRANGVISKVKALYEVQYVDAGTHYSPLASPKLSSTANSLRDDDKSVLFADALSHQEPETALKRMDPSEAPFTPSKPSSTMVSTSCQTSSQLPSPPWTPLTPHDPMKDELSAGSPTETQMTSIGTQTDATVEAEDSDAKISANSSQKPPIPTIAIHPPASRPTTPTSDVVLPPQTKNASCQVNFPAAAGYTSSSMQTAEIRVDARTHQLPQKFLPPRRPLQPTDSALFRKSAALQPANPLPNSSKRRLQQPGSIKPATSRRRVLEPHIEAAVPSPTPELEEPIASTQAENMTRTSESSTSAFADENHEKGNIAEPERKRFDEDDIFSRPTAKFTLRAGKLVSKDEPETDYQDIFDKIDAEAHEPELSPTDTMSKELPSMPPRRGLQGNDPPTRLLERRPKTLRSTSSKQFDIRKAALISSGTAAHQSTRDQSPSAPVKPPPFPVPTRHSSRKLPISVSEGAQSPTPTGRSPRKRDGKGRQPLLRKVRSATSVSRPSAAGHRRTPSPPLLPSHFHTTNDPSLPLPPLPRDDTAPAPGLDLATSSRRRPPIRQDSHPRTDSANTVLQQTSVVDAIAQTMVGEWMYKYVRRRKSFGVPEPKNQDWDLMRNGDELSASITNTGVRHKRWVWLAPYERAVMWSSKQPTSGSALMGKSGRKLEIQSVLDVRDDNPLPRGSGSGPNFHRSILILTPERALKFTATSQERHYVWLTALSFLSHSPLGFGDLTALPNIPQQEYLAPRQIGGSVRRNPIRDSIRVAKGRDPRGGRSGQRSFTTDGVIPQYPVERDAIYQPRNDSLYQPVTTAYQPISDAADPPTIPRHHSHSRHRSNTGPRPPPPSFRNLSNHNPAQPPPSTYSMTTATASDVYTPPLYHGHSHPSDFHSAKSSFSRRRGSEASASVANSGAGAGYSDQHVTAPTMRMEAFIGEEGGQRPRGSYRTRQGRKKDMGYWGVGERAVTMPGVELPDEVVGHGHRSSSRSPTVNGNGDDNADYPAMGMQIDAASILSEENFRGKRRVRQEDWAFEAGHVNHFRGF